MEFELKHADSGHSESIHLKRGLMGIDIMNQIGNSYKINPKDQLLITKIGRTIEANHPLDKIFTHSLQDKTVTSNYKNAQTDNQRVFCIALYNLKQLQKQSEVLEGKPKSYWVEQLKDKLINQNLNSTVFPYDSLNQSFENEELLKFERAVQKINALRESYRTLANEYSNMKSYNFMIEQAIERCKNQKKSSDILARSIKNQLSIFQFKLKQIDELKQNLKSKFAIDDKSLRENSGFFQNKKKYQSSVSLYESQINNLKQWIGPFESQFKVEFKNIKLQFKFCEARQMEFGNIKYNDKLNEIQANNKRDYDQIFNIFSQLAKCSPNNQAKVATALENKIQRATENVSILLLDEFTKICSELTNYYCEFNQFNQENKLKMKNIFQWYQKQVNQIRNYIKTAYSIEKAIRSEIEQQNKRKNSVINKNMQEHFRNNSESQVVPEKINLESLEIERRIRFKKMLNSFQSLATKICQQEQNLRKKFVNELKNVEKCEFEGLRNIKVPQVDFDDNNSSDLQLMKVYKSSSSIEVREPELNIQQFMIYNFNLILEKIKAINANDNNSKVKNLNEVIKRLSDVFAKVYNKKIDDLITEKQAIASKIPEFESRITVLQSQLKDSKSQIIDLTRKISEKQDKLIAREKQRSEEINKQRTKYQKLLSDFKSLEKSLNKQTKVNEQLYNQFMKSDDELKDSVQLNEYLKELLAQKQIQIIQIQKKILEKPKEVQPSVENDLKSAVLNNFSKNLNEAPQKDEQIQRLNQEISLLQKENEELQEDYEELSAQMRKIITKQTQDIQVQVNTEEPAVKSLYYDGITIGEDITVGQNALFMPFSNAIYVGVCHKEDDRTICNLNSVQYTNHFLDLASFNMKTKQLLSQCSFLVVVHVTNIERQGKHMKVKGQIRYLFGFEDDNMTIKNYTPLLPN